MDADDARERGDAEDDLGDPEGEHLVRAIRRRDSGTLADAEIVRTARRITVRYVVDGKAHEIEGSTNYNLGTRIAVRYLPGSPHRGVIVDENFGAVIAAFVVAVVFGIFGAGMLWFAFHTR